MVRAIWLVLMLGLLLTACARPITAQSAHFKVGMTLELVGLGKRPVTITVHDLSGRPMSDATVTLFPVMRQHGMLAPPISSDASEPGVFLFPDVNLDMSGEWQMQLTIVAGSVTDMIEIPVVIE